VNSSGESGFSISNNTTPHEKEKLNMNNSTMLIGKAAQRFPNEETGKGDRLSRKQETALGDLVADSMVYWIRKHKAEYQISGSIDFGFVNGGVITRGLDKGNITVGTVKGLLYGDQMSILTLKGSQILDLFQYVAQVRHTGGGGSGTGAFGQVSKEVRYTINYTYGSDPTRGDLEGFTLNGEPLGPNKDYTFITSTYLVEGGDGYGAYLQTERYKHTGLLIAQALADYIYDQDMVPLTPQTDGRITLVGEVWSTSMQTDAATGASRSSSVNER
jgi:2',3'-cyclic-nucleotide 2'-phosphodiesterase (5'-nucleotidase family)